MDALMYVEGHISSQNSISAFSKWGLCGEKRSIFGSGSGFSGVEAATQAFWAYIPRILCVRRLENPRMYVGMSKIGQERGPKCIFVIHLSKWGGWCSISKPDFRYVFLTDCRFPDTSWERCLLWVKSPRIDIKITFYSAKNQDWKSNTSPLTWRDV